jgi:hypothetical protein
MFEVTEDVDGGYVAECLTETIVTQGDTWEELRANVKDAVEGFYFDGEKPSVVRMRLVDENSAQPGWRALPPLIRH